jgi:hypothetical protein
MAPPFGNVGGSKCTSGRTNIDCNDIGIPQHEDARAVRAPARAPMLQRDLPICHTLAVRSYGPKWAGRDAWVTHGDGRTRQVPADAAKNATPPVTLLPRHYHARIARHYSTT